MGTRQSDLGGADPLSTADEARVVGADYPSSEAIDGDALTPDATSMYAPGMDTFMIDEGEAAFSEDEDPEIDAQRQQIEQTRTELSGTIDAIQSKLSPENLVAEAKGAVMDATVGSAQQVVGNVTDTAQQVVGDVGGAAADVGSSIVETIRANPIPAALTGVGLGWLFMSFRNRSSSTGSKYSGRDQGAYSPYGYGYPQGGYSSRAGTSSASQGTIGSIAGQAQNVAGSAADQVQSTASQVQGAASQAVGQVQDAAGQAVGQVQDAAGQAVGQAQAQAGQIANQAQYGVQRAQSQLDRWMQERPLAVTAGALALGVVAGLAIPETPQEDQLLGEARETVSQRAQQMVQQTAQKVETVAEDALDAAKQSAQDQGLSGQSASKQSTSSTSQSQNTSTQ